MPPIAQPIDPRDTSWRIDTPPYRVYFFDEHHAADEWRLDGVTDVYQAISWADEHAAGRTYVLYVEVAENGRGLVRLVGTDPNDRG